MGWDFLTCVHGIQEGLDSHSCSDCQEIAKKCKYDTSKGQTYIFVSQKQIDKELKKSSNGK
jgi:hypothetical protein